MKNKVSTSILLIGLLVIIYSILCQIPSVECSGYPIDNIAYLPIVMSNYEYQYNLYRAELLSDIGDGRGNQCVLQGHFYIGETRGSGTDYNSRGYVRVGTQDYFHTDYYNLYFGCTDQTFSVCSVIEEGGICVSNIVQVSYRANNPSTHRVDFFRLPTPQPVNTLIPPTDTPTNIPVPTSTPSPTEPPPTPMPTWTPYPTSTPVTCPVVPRYGASGCPEGCYVLPDYFTTYAPSMGYFGYIEFDSALSPHCGCTDYLYYRLIHPNRIAEPCEFFEDDMTGNRQHFRIYHGYNRDKYYYLGWELLVYKQNGEFVGVVPCGTCWLEE